MINNMSGLNIGLDISNFSTVTFIPT